MLFGWFVFLESLVLISVGQRMIVDIRQVRAVFLEGLVPSDEGVIEPGADLSSIPDSTAIHIHVGDIEVVALFGALMEARAFVSATEALIHSVPVDTPHVGDLVFYVLIVGLFSQESRCDEPKD